MDPNKFTGLLIDGIIRGLQADAAIAWNVLLTHPLDDCGGRRAADPQPDRAAHAAISENPPPVPLSHV